MARSIQSTKPQARSRKRPRSPSRISAASSSESSSSLSELSESDSPPLKKSRSSRLSTKRLSKSVGRRSARSKDDYSEDDISRQDRRRKTLEPSRLNVEGLLDTLKQLDPIVLSKILDAARGIEPSSEADKLEDTTAVENGVLFELEEDTFDEEEERQLNAKADKLAMQLSGPFKALQDGWKFDIESKLKALSRTLEVALKPIHGDDLKKAIPEQLETWESAETQLRRKNINIWTDFTTQAKTVIITVDKLSGQIAGVQSEKLKLVEEARKKIDALLIRQAKEVEGYQGKLEKSRDSLFPKMEQATDKQIRTKMIHVMYDRALEEATKG